jgi:hypothetical protein
VGFIAPSAPDFDVEEWAQRPYPERLRMMCESWGLQGFGAPGVAYAFYVLKIALYIGGFLFFVTSTRGVGGVGDLADWWSAPIAFQKGIIWTFLFEGIGLGCGSGPLTGRYLPPVTAFAYWLRPGTTRLRPFAWVPATAGSRRTVVDVALYAGVLVAGFRALTADELTRGVLWPMLVVTVALGLRDKTAFLAFRSEHYLLTAFVFLFPDDVIAGSKAVQAALWFGAATSKLNQHFPNVIAVMMSNSPLVRGRWLRSKLFRDYPSDMRGSRLSAAIGHAGTVVEFAFPLVLVFSPWWPLTVVGLVVMVTFHSIILTSFPLGVPLEWNVWFIYSGLVLFSAHHDERIWSMHSPLLAAVLIVFLVAVPVYGNLRPDKVSFLPGLRYYAGNWATSLWLWRPGLFESMPEHLTVSAPPASVQVSRLYGEGSYDLIVARVQAFRSMHLHGRALNGLLPLAVADLDDAEVRAKGLDAFQVVDGELVAGSVLGWNFGEGHLHHEQLLAAIQEQWHLEPGQVRCVLLEAQPAFDPTMRWRIVDAATGEVASGHLRVDDLLARQPWDMAPL